MQIGSVVKLIVAVVAIICLTVLMALGSIGEAAGMAPITAIIFYILGNGVAAIQGKPVSSIIEARNIEAVDVDRAG